MYIYVKIYAMKPIVCVAIIATKVAQHSPQITTSIIQVSNAMTSRLHPLVQNRLLNDPTLGMNDLFCRLRYGRFST